MDTAYLHMSAAFVLSLLFAYLTGRMWGALLPTLIVATYMSAGASEKLDWFIALFLFGFIGYGVISLAGAGVGVALYEMKHKNKKCV